MRVIDIVPRDIYATMEFSTEEIRDLSHFLEKAIPLYNKVYLNGPIEQSLRSIDNFKKQLKSISEAIKKETA